MTGRSNPEWIADHPDQAIPTRVKARIFARCEGRCARTGQKVRAGEYQFDHIIALENGGQHRESNLQVLSTEAHKAKTRADMDVTKKVRRLHAKHHGYWPESRSKLRSRGFSKTRPELP